MDEIRINGLHGNSNFLFLIVCVELAGVRRKDKFTTYSQGLLIDNDFVKASLDQATTDILKLFPSLDQKIIPNRNFNWNTLSSIPRPDMEYRVSRTTMDREEIKIGVKSCQYRVFLSISDQVRGSGSEKMRTLRRN